MKLLQILFTRTPSAASSAINEEVLAARQRLQDATHDLRQVISRVVEANEQARAHDVLPPHPK